MQIPSRIKLILTGFPHFGWLGYEFGFSPILKYEYRTGNKGYRYPPRTHTQIRFECIKSIYYPFYINRNSNPKPFHSHDQSLSLKYDTHFSEFSILPPCLTFSVSLFSITIAIDCHHFFVGQFITTSHPGL